MAPPTTPSPASPLPQPGASALPPTPSEAAAPLAPGSATPAAPSSPATPSAAAAAPSAEDRAVLDAILHRRSVIQFRPECPPRAAIERLLQAGLMAPNHFLNQPWRFIVLTGPACRAYGDFLAERLRPTLPRPDAPEALAALEAERSRPLRAPVLIVGAATRTGHPKSIWIEDVAATAAALENMLLAAPALGLGAYWRTGGPAHAADVKAYFGLREDEEIVGFLYVGYPEAVREPRPRAALDEKVEWRGWDG